MIIDDEPDVAGSLSDILELMGLRSEIITTWTSPADILRGIEPDIVFSDLRMPGKSGIAIYRELLQERPGLARRFVLVTGDMIGARGRRSSKSRSARSTCAACLLRSMIRSASRYNSSNIQIAASQKPPAGRNAAEGFRLRWTVSVRICLAC